MKAIVYTSNTGSAKEYAKMLGKKIKSPVYSLKEAKKKLKKKSEIIYFGWLMAGICKGYKKAKKLFNVKAVCGVGMGKSGSQINDMRKVNKTNKDLPIFNVQGNFDINKLKGIYKFMMSFVAKTTGEKTSKKKNKTAEELEMLDMIRNGAVNVNEKNLAPLIEWYSKQ